MNKDDLCGMTRRQLLDLAKKAGIRRRHRMVKDRLMAELCGAAPAGSTEPAPDAGLPARYGRTRLILMDVEPYWLFAYWEITPEDRRAAERHDPDAAGKAWVLRFYDITMMAGVGIDRCGHFDLPVDPDAGNWYINLWEGGRSYIAELGVCAAGRKFVPACRSNRVHAPRSGPAPDTELRWIKVDAYPRAVEEAAKPQPAQVKSQAPTLSIQSDLVPEWMPDDPAAADAAVRAAEAAESSSDVLEREGRKMCYVSELYTGAGRESTADAALQSSEAPLLRTECSCISSESAGSFGLGRSGSQERSGMKRRK